MDDETRNLWASVGLVFRLNDSGELEVSTDFGKTYRLEKEVVEEIDREWQKKLNEIDKEWLSKRQTS